MTRAQARETAREILEIMPLVMRTRRRGAARRRRDAGAGAFRPARDAQPSGRGRSPSSPRCTASACRRCRTRSRALVAARLGAARGARRRSAGRDDRGDGRPAAAALERVSRSAEAHLAEVLAPLDGRRGGGFMAGLGVLRKVFATPPARTAGGRRDSRVRE